MLLDRYRARSQKVLNWQKEKEAFLGENVDKDNVSIQSLRAKINLLKAFDEEFQQVVKTQDQTILIGQEIIDGNHSSADEVTESNANMKIGKANIGSQKEEKIKLLEETLKYKLEIEQQCIDFAKKLDQLNLFLEEVALSVSEPVRASSVKDVDNAYGVINGLLKSHADNKKNLTDAQEIHKKITQAGEDPHQYCATTLENIQKKYDAAQKDMNEKKQTLENERKKQEKFSSVITAFNKLCSDYITWANTQLKALQAESKGTLEEQLTALQKLGEKVVKESHDQLQKGIKEANHLDELDIAEMVEHTVQELQACDDQIKSAFSKRTKAIEAQIISKKLGSVTKEQLDEFHETFKHFDKTGRNALGKNDFKAACASVGEDIPDNELDSVFKSYDKNNDGLISFEEFTEYMSSIVKEGTGYEDVLASFKELSGGAEFITEAQIKGNMEKDEAEYLVNNMPKHKGGQGYDYKLYADKLFGK